MSPASRMLSAISFGVFCRLAPSTSAIIRSRKVSPGLEVIRTTIRSDSTRVPPVTAERSPPDSRITGADSPVIADSSTDAMPSTISPSPGMISPGHDLDDVVDEEFGSTRPRSMAPSAVRRLATVSERALAQRVGLRLAAPFGHGLGEVGEQHGEPEPGGDETGEHVLVGVAAGEVAEEQERREDAAELDDEHDRVARHRARVELAERVRRSGAGDIDRWTSNSAIGCWSGCQVVT